MKQVLITGGAGFVGRNLVARLLSDSSIEQVRVFDREPFGQRGANHGGRLAVYCSDIRDRDSLELAMNGCDTVFHLASNADIAKATSDPDIDFRDGTILTRDVLEAMRMNGANRLIYFSGSGVYGDFGRCAMYEDATICRPISPYGASKLASEAMISAYCSMFEMTAFVFRPANIVGPGQTHGVGLDFVRQLKEHPSFLTVLGDGSQLKSYIDIDDALDAVLWAIERAKDKTGFDIFNLSNEDPITVKSIAELARDICSHADPFEFRYKGGDRGWKGDVPEVHLSSFKLGFDGPMSCSLSAMERAMRSML